MSGLGKRLNRRPKQRGIPFPVPHLVGECLGTFDEKSNEPPLLSLSEAQNEEVGIR